MGARAVSTVCQKMLQIWEARVVRSVWRGKTGRPQTEKSIRSFAISSDLYSHLARRRQHQEDSCLVFSTRNGTPWDEGLLVKRKLHPLLDRLGIARAGLGFRHGNSSFMDQHNTPTAVRLNRLGHADVRMMANYSHPIGDDRHVAREIGELLAPKCAENGNGLSEAIPITQRIQ